MPLFRRKAETPLPRTSSISIYGQGRAQALQKAKNSDKHSNAGSFSSFDLDDRPYPLAFAEATFDPSLPIKNKSRLSKDLDEVLADNSALAYFIQFMDAHRVKHLVKFWLEAESFRISSETKLKSENKKMTLLQTCDVNISASSSGNSSYVSDKSEEVFQSSSHATCSSSKVLDHKVDIFEKNLHDPNLKTLAVNINDNNTVPLHISYNETVKFDFSCGNSSNDKPSKIVQQSSSIDSGCEERAKELTFDCSLTDSKSIPVNSGKNNAKLSGIKKEWNAENEVLSKDNQRTELLKGGLVRLETSIEQDANSIYCKYIALDASFPVGVSEELRTAIKNDIFNSSGDIDPQCFVPAQDFVFKRMEKEYFPNFLRSNFHCKHQIDVLTSGNVFLADVLYNDSALFYFMEFMEQEGVRHLVDFLLMADNFQKHLLSHQGKYDGLQAQTDAMVLYDKYFSLQATIPLGFSDEVRYEVEANICREGGPLPDCFLKPVKILTQYLEKTYLLQFLNSQLYFKYISECIIIIQSGGTDSPLQQKYTGSDSGSEQSLPISSVNTLLAMDTKHQSTSKIIKNLDDQDMRIDTQQFNPDALWQRPLAGKLQMAHVDHLGRVTTEFEPDPEKKRESRISRAVKKLVNWDANKSLL
ncbi:A-kinase anchor protein 10, mitochondrial-like isoform X2 [Stegodyphus dumicola]|uniref:A-kinase anchor protein 10, mitochondrial-like isoform X2 n=1 Tax=Stegodyphus dumicola TaxID=202533 RepID=UPI0015A9B57E|nr:A-kinase anchor protein 10, mitochondrial-like isoform X2 [Stegodyphus dumicola]